MKFLILNGPNLNLLGQRDEATYGSETLSDIENHLRDSYSDHDFIFVQSNHEGDLIDAIVANWGGFTHSSVAIHDALELVSIPKVEVHISNIHAREEFRERSITGKAMDGVITGFGINSYVLGVQAALQLISKK